MKLRWWFTSALVAVSACATPFDSGATNFHCLSDDDCLEGYACQSYPGSTSSLCLAEPRWESLTEGTVVDHHLRLKWQRDIETSAAACSDDPDVAWRLPTIDELRSLVDPNDCHNTALGGQCAVMETSQPCLTDTLSCNPANACRDCPVGGAQGGCFHDEEVWDPSCPPRPLLSSSPVTDAASDDVFWVLNLATGRITPSDTAPPNVSALVRCVTTL